MSKAIAHRIVNTLEPQAATAPRLRVRLVADAFIPWDWVQFPEPPAFLVPMMVQAPAGLAGAAFDFFVHGDGRLPVMRSDSIGKRYRIRGAVDVDVVEKPGESFDALAQNQPSKSELRFVNGKVLHTETGRNKTSSKFDVRRLSPSSVRVQLDVSGGVPWNVAGPQPPIDFGYAVDLSYDAALRKVMWRVEGDHDGFPGHEVFIESGGAVHFNRSYLPVWFAKLHTGTAHPSIMQACDGAMALGGLSHRQAWAESGSFVA